MNDVDVIRSFYTAFAEGRLDYIRDELLTDEVTFHVPGRGTLAGEYRGKDEVTNYLAKVAEAGTVMLNPSSFLSGDGHIAVVLDVDGSWADRKLKERGMQLFHVVDGKVAERWSYPPESYATDAYFS